LAFAFVAVGAANEIDNVSHALQPDGRLRALAANRCSRLSGSLQLLSKAAVSDRKGSSRATAGQVAREPSDSVAR
jgi:hypothetical protein